MIKGTREERFRDLPFRKYRAACKAEHTRRLATPWYIRQGNVIQETHRTDNSAFMVWSRQAKHYAAWYAEEHCRRADWVTGVYTTDKGDVWATMADGPPVRLPRHVALGYVQAAPFGEVVE